MKLTNNINWYQCISKERVRLGTGGVPVPDSEEVGLSE